MTRVGEVPDILVGAVQFQIGSIFWRNDAGAHLVDVTVVFKEIFNKSVDALT